MGWSWASFFARDAVAKRFGDTGGVGGSDALRERSPAPCPHFTPLARSSLPLSLCSAHSQFFGDKLLVRLDKKSCAARKNI